MNKFLQNSTPFKPKSVLAVTPLRKQLIKFKYMCLCGVLFLRVENNAIETFKKTLPEH